MGRAPVAENRLPRIRQNPPGSSRQSARNPHPDMDSAHNGHATPQAIHLTIPAKPEYITLGRLALTGIARLRAEPVSAEVLGDLKLALTEACTNSVRHAYAGDEGTVQIVYEL